MTAAAAPFGARFLAGAVDWTAALVVPFLVAGSLATPLWPVVIATTVLAWFSVSLRRGRTPGMRALGLRVEGPRQREPRAGRAVARSLLSVVHGFLAIAVFAVAAGGAEASAGVATTLLGAAALAVAAHVPLRDGRSALDRAFRLSVLRPEPELVAPAR